MWYFSSIHFEKLKVNCVKDMLFTVTIYLLLVTLYCTSLSLHAQNTATSSGQGLCAWKVPTATVPFDINYEGEPFRIRWGMDTAWDSEVNVRRGIAFIGKNQIELARASFNPNYDLTASGELSSGHKTLLNSRLSHIGLIGKHVEILFNDDPVDGVVKDMYKNDPTGWARLFDKTVEYAQKKGFKVASIAPYNEPDYGWGQGSKADFLNICKAVRNGSFPRLDTIRLCGGNTLNDDKALEWYNYLKDYLEEGNTHQLAGSFDNYANFFTQVKADGKIGTADELHNIMEAMVGVQYGMTNGIWWGFDGLARGEFCRASFGDRLSYVESRDTWTAASVYRNTLDNRYEAFVGTSERQANKASYLFVSKDRDVYFDGYGPQREFLVQTPGGTGYQQGQTNAERVVFITFGEDVPPAPVNGTYLLMNKTTKMVMQPQGGGTGDGTAIVQAKNTKKDYQQWDVVPVDSAHGGDFSYYTIRGVKSKKVMDVWNWNLSSGGAVNLYDGSEGDNELWWLEYAGDGFYYIHSKYSNLVLGVNGTSANSPVVQLTKATTATAQGRQLWRLIPTDATCELTPPAVPSALRAEGRSASIHLSWVANTEEDLLGYTILRAEKSNGEWNTIARNVEGTEFVDNLCRQGTDYLYKVKAVDRTWNSSACCDSVSCRTSGEQTLIMQLEFDGDLSDLSVNALGCAHYGKTVFNKSKALHKSGEMAVSLDGTKYIQLPYSVGNMTEMTICGWFYLKTSSGNWQRLFDFGNGTDQYMFLCPDNGSDMRFVMKNGGDEEILSVKKLGKGRWHHVAVTIGHDKVVLYVDGEAAGESTDMTIRPSDIRPVMCYIGRSQFVADPLFNGYVDDFRIYNYPLTLTEIQDIITVATDIQTMSEVGSDGFPSTNSVQTKFTNQKKSYDLQGKAIDDNYRGIIIRQGKKELKR